MTATRKYSQTTATIQPWIDQHEQIQNYIQKLNANKKRSAVYLYQYCEWANKTPKQLLDLKSTVQDSDAEKLLDKFTITQTQFPDSTKSSIINCVKGFYRTNYHQLQSAAGKFEYTPTKTQSIISKENRLKLYKACYTPRDRALVVAACCTSIARETMSSLKWSHLEENWMQQETPCIQLPSNIVKGHGKGKYRGVQQICFLSPEAKQAFKEYREWYQKTFNYTWKTDDNVFLVVRKNISQPLTAAGISLVISYITKRAGVRFGIHDGRRIVQTALENVNVSPQWIRKIKGRKVKGEESPYSRPAVEQLRSKYREALPDLQFLKDQPQSIDRPGTFLSRLVEVLEQNPEKAEKFAQLILKL